MHTNYILHSKDELTSLVKSKGISNWGELIYYVKSLPYGRPTYASDLSQVLAQHRGTCSTKHALLKKVADLNNIPDVQLIMGMYKMNNINTPKIGITLNKYNLKYIPEAHCYLSIKNKRCDYTSLNSDFNKIKHDLLIEQKIAPNQIFNYKPAYHKDYLKNWIINKKIPYTLDSIWNIREECINKLAQNGS